MNRVQLFKDCRNKGGGASLRSFNVNMWFGNNQSYNRPYLAVSPDGTLIYVTDMDEYFKHQDMRMRYFADGLPTSTTVRAMAAISW